MNHCLPCIVSEESLVGMLQNTGTLCRYDEAAAARGLEPPLITKTIQISPLQGARTSRYVLVAISGSRQISAVDLAPILPINLHAIVYISIWMIRAQSSH
jgi:hypothetical protein